MTSNRAQPAGALVHRLIEHHAIRTPNALAVRQGGREWTYGELDRRAGRLARRLRQLAVGSEEVVALLIPRSPELVMGALAVLKAGGAYLPLDLAHPPERLTYMVRDAGTRVLLAAATPATVPEGVELVLVDQEEPPGAVESDAGGPARARPAEPDRESLAYVIYTSGSTGRPKGVEVSHAGLANLVAWHRSAYDVTPGDRATLLAAPGFDASVWEMWAHLAAGASLHIPPPEILVAPSELWRWLADERITISFLPTPLAEALLAEPRRDGMALRWLLTGGDKLHLWAPKRAPFALVNHYGPTEASVVTTSALVPVAPSAAGAVKGLPPIGRPLPGIEVHLMDGDLNPVLPGTPGELFIGGLGLARAYRSRPGPTAERFVPHPGAGRFGKRLYRTGDLACWQPNGLEFLGRIDQQVQVRGFRIELGEVKAALLEHAAVREAVVVARGEGAGRYLAAYVVLARHRGTEPEGATAELREHLKGKLPDYMIPSRMVELEALPLTPNGKVDLRALPESDAVGVAVVAPRTPMEKVVAEVWAQVLGRESLSVHDHFLELGGNSLAAGRIAGRLRERLEVEVPVQVLFEAPTVEALAARLQNARKARAEILPAVILPAVILPEAIGEAGDAPLSFAQQRLWLLAHQQPDSPFYNEPVNLRLDGSLSIPALAAALAEIVRRHQALRSAFPVSMGSPRVTVSPPGRLDLPVVDLGVLDSPRRRQEADRVASHEGSRVFDLARGPLFRVCLTRLGEQEHLLLLSFHHVVFDGWSVAVLLEELVALYRAAAGGSLSPLPELPIQYSDFAAWQRGWLRGEELERQLTYWRQALDGLADPDLPADRPRPPRRAHRAGSLPLVPPPGVGEALRALGRAEEATPFMICLAAFGALVARLCGEDDLPVGTAVANRARTDVEALIGFFANTLVMRVDLRGDPTFPELLRRVRRSALEAFSHQDLPFERLVEELAPERDPGRNPLFQVALAFQPTPHRIEVAETGLSLTPEEPQASFVRFDLELLAWEGPQGLAGRLIYSSDLFDTDTASRWRDRLGDLLTQVAADPDRRLSRFPALAAAAQEARVGFEWIGDARVDLRRTEAELLADPEVADCALLVREVPARAAELVAYVVRSDAAATGRRSDPFLRRLRSRLAQRLPAPLVPSALVPVASIPLTRSGGVDRQALARLEVLDGELLSRWETRVSELPGVERAAVVARETAPTPRAPLHLADLLAGQQAPVGAMAPRPADERQSIASEADARSRDGKLTGQPAASFGEPLRKPAGFPHTLPEALGRAARRGPDNQIFFLDAEEREDVCSYSELLEDAERILGGLRRQGLRPGDPVLLQLPHALDFFAAFWSCQLGGLVPVPVAIAPSYEASSSAVDKLRNSWELLDRPPVLTDGNLGPSLIRLWPELGFGKLEVEILDELRADEPDTAWYRPEPGDLALLLLTSGSSRKPKAVRHTHATMLARTASDIQWNGFTESEVSLNWFPLDHVCSLVQFHLRDLHLTARQIHVPPEVVLQEPLRWLDLIERYQVTVTWAPNFAYGLIAAREEDLRRRSWNLKSMRFFLNGGEGIVARTARRFLRCVAPHGVPPDALRPVWGMSETAAGATCSRRFSLETTRDDDPFVEVGEPLPGLAFRIVDELDQVVMEGAEGHLQVRGAAVTPGYHLAPELDREAFTADGWFRTGDRALLDEGRLTLTGRAKDVLIIHGNNFYCHEIESVVEEVEGVQVSYTAAVAIRPPGAETDELAVFFSPQRSDDAAVAGLVREIRRRVARGAGVTPAYLIPVRPEELSKTGIGKIQRSELRRRFAAGDFAEALKRVDVLTENANTLPDWFFRRVWCPRKGTAIAAGPIASDGVLVFLDHTGLGERFLAGLAAGATPWATVEEGSGFARAGAHRYRVRPGEPQDYRRLFEALDEDGFRTGRILHLWTYGPPRSGPPTRDDVTRAQERGALSLLGLAQALAQARHGQGTVDLEVVGSHTQAVAEQETVAWERATILGLARTLPQEWPWLRCRHLDLQGDAVAADAAQLVEELRRPPVEPEVVFRGGSRLVPRLERIDFALGGPRPVPLRYGGRYLVTGGLGGVGTVLARHLLERCGARLLLLGRTPLPAAEEQLARSSGESAETPKIHALAELRSLSGELIYEAVDVADLPRLEEIVSGAEARWGGRLDGIFHLAGVVHERLLAEETREGLEEALHPKLMGAWALDRLLDDRPGTLFVSFSSVNGFLGGVTVGAYAAANSFLPALAAAQQRRSPAAGGCVAWSMWDEIGMSRGYAAKQLSRSRGYHTIGAEQGIRSLEVALAHGQVSAVVGLDASSREIRRHLAARDSRALQLCAFVTAADGAQIRDALVESDLTDRFGRPSLCEVERLEEMPVMETGEVDRGALASRAPRDGMSGRRRIPPRTDTERCLAAIWHEVLDLPSVGLEDDFFELGGHSLLATQVLSRIEKAFGIEVSLQDLFAASTLGGLASIVDRQVARREALEGDGELEELLREIAGLSEAEAQAALAQAPVEEV